MLWYEEVVSKVQHLVATDTIVDGISYVALLSLRYA